MDQPTTIDLRDPGLLDAAPPTRKLLYLVLLVAANC